MSRKKEISWDNLTNGALIEQAKKNPEAFGKFFERHHIDIYRYVYCRTGSHYDAQDLTSRTFHNALGAIDRFEDRNIPPKAWLYRIAHNLTANFLRDRNRRKTIPLHQLIPRDIPHPERQVPQNVLADRDGKSPERIVIDNEEKEALLGAIQRLPFDRQQLVALKLGEGMTNQEIGQIMGRSVSAIKSLYFRTLIELREDLENRGF